MKLGGKKMKRNKMYTFINILFAGALFLIILLLLFNSKQIWDSFYEAIILSRAYQGIWKGLKITVIMTLGGLFLGTILGSLICMMRMSKVYSIKLFGRVLIEVLRGTPVVMLLMFLYFFVFMGNSIDALYVAIIGYGMNTGSHVAEIFRTSIEAIDPKEIEAARMLGFSKIKAFVNITLPQSWEIAKPVYESAIISLIQWTSVAGYISVTELTRIINGLGSRTGSYFFSLVLGIMIYLSLAYIVRFIFLIMNKRGDSYDKN